MGVVSDIYNATDAELQAELERRKPFPPLIQPLPSPDFSGLQQMITDETVRSTEKDYYERDDFKHYVYEAAMEAVYGKAYWIWRRQQRWAQ